MRKYLYFFRMALIEIFEYRANFYWAITGIAASNVITYIFWVAVLGSGFTKTDYTTSSIGLYFLIMALVGRITDFNSNELASSIHAGDISTSLLKPYNYTLKTLMTTCDDRFFKSLVTLIIVSILMNLGNLHILSHQLPYFLLSVSLAAASKFFLGLVLGSLAFWFSRVHGFSSLFWNIGSLFSGEMIPPEFLPEVLSKVSLFLPFSYLAYFPTRLLVRSLTISEIALGISIQIAWMSLFYLTYRFIWSRGIGRIESVGG